MPMSRPLPTIKDYMTSTIHSIGAEQTIARAHAVMREHQIRHLPVLQGGKLVGVLSDRDLYWMETLRDVDANSMRVDEGMAQIPYAVSPDTPLYDVAREMAEHKYGSAVVMSHEKVVGVFTTTGTGSMHAVGSTAHFLVVAESLLGPMIAFVAAGLFIARLTRPRARLRFSESMVVAPYEAGRGLMFRFVNELPSELTDVKVEVSLSWSEVSPVVECNTPRLYLGE